MIGIFKANNPFNLFLLFIYGLMLKLPCFLHPRIPIVQKSDGFLFRGLLLKLDNIGLQFPFIYPLITFLLLFTQAVSFNRLINDQKMMQKANYLPATSYLLITSMFTEWYTLSAPLVINTLLIWVWARMSSLYGSQKPKSTLYNIGIMIGVSSFFYFPSLAFVLLIIFALIVSRPFKLAEWVIAFLGILTPYYFFFSWLFLTDKIYGYKYPQFELGYPRFHQNYWELAGMCLILIALLTGFFYMQANLKKQLVQIRKSWGLILLYLLVGILVTFINATHTFEYWVLAAVPLCAYIACAFFYPVKRWIPALLHWLMVIVAIIISYGLNPIENLSLPF